MQLVYATGYREREFQIAESRTEVPSGARVYATCTKENTVEDVGEVTFQGMSEDEYYSLKAMVREARERARAEKLSAGEEASSLRSLIGRLFSR